MMFQPMVEKLLNFEQCYFDSLFKSKLGNISKYGHALDIVG
jgi:hypothetical protein